MKRALQQQQHKQVCVWWRLRSEIYYTGGDQTPGPHEFGYVMLG